MRKQITQVDFKELLKDFQSINNCLIIKDYDIFLDGFVNIDVFNRSYKFENCTIKGGRLDFYDFQFANGNKQDYHSIEFNNCDISTDLFIKDSKLNTLNFSNVRITSNHFHITSSEILNIRINSSATKRSEIINLMLHQLNYEKTIVDFTFNVFQHLTIKDCVFRKFFGINNFFSEIYLTKIEVIEEFVFNKSNVESVFELRNSDLTKSNFYQSSLPQNCDIKNTVFKEITNFNYLQSNTANLYFDTCVFENIVNFDNSKFGQLKFVGTVFKDISTFNNVEFNYNFLLENSHFEKNAFFGKLLELNSVKLFDLNTLRTIKAQLLKADNRIDYNRVNAYEQRKYFQEISFKDSDYYILWLNKISNNFGTSWVNGIWFTLKCSILFFTLLLLVNGFVKSSYPLSIDLDGQWAKFDVVLAEFLNFIFSLGFSSPEFQSNGWLFLIFIFAKIFIGFGIYQTVAAFRKFR